MKKAKKISIAVVVVILACLCLAGCTVSKKASPMVIGGKYDEAAFAQEMAKAKENNVNFATGGQSAYLVVYPSILEEPFQEVPGGERRSKLEEDRITLKNSVEFLTKTLFTMVGCEFHAVTEEDYSDGDAIFIALDAGLQDVADSGYHLKIDEGTIKISALDYKGLENGIYSFLEKYLGCMFVSVDYDYIPKLSTINFAKTDISHNPDTKWREVYANESEKNKEIAENEIQWANKLRLNGAGGEGWGNWCHTFYSYIPPEEFFESHPEYFAEYNGKRSLTDGPVQGQLCLTNENVYRIVSERLFAKMEENPETKHWDVSQMDTWINRGTGCRCKNCKALDDAEDSSMGSLLPFINRLAEECAVKFPCNFISTLAYNYTATPPKTLKPRDNVIIKLCLMPGDVASDVKNPRNDKAQISNKIISDWGKISKNLLIWDYNVNFHQYLMPYPIFSAMKANNDFYLDNNVYGMFHQMDWDAGGYGAELSAYVFSQLMWDREVDVEAIISKYLKVYYGDAGAYLTEYYNALEKNVYAANRALYIYSTIGENRADYLSNQNVSYYLSLFEKAENAVKENPELLARVKKAKIGVLYVKAQEVTLNKTARLAALEEFKTLCEVNNIHSLYEGDKGNGDEVTIFYQTQLNIINAFPWIIVGIVFACVVFVGGVVLLGFCIKKHIKKKKMKAASIS